MRISPTLNGSSALQCVKLGDAPEIRNGIIFDFYLGLPHIHVVKYIDSDNIAQAVQLSKHTLVCLDKYLPDVLH